jgi:hypothetical protein
MDQFTFSIYGVEIHVIIRENMTECMKEYNSIVPEDSRGCKAEALGNVIPFGRNAQDDPEVFVLLAKCSHKHRFNALLTHEATHIAQFIYEIVCEQSWHKMTKASGFEEPFAYLIQLIVLLIESIHETGEPDLWFFDQAENINFKLI